MPPYLIGDSDIDPKFLNIQKIYDSLYLDDGKEFKYIGFKEAEKRENFFRELLLVINLLKNKLNDEYIIEDNMDFLKKTINQIYYGYTFGHSTTYNSCTSIN